MVKHLMRYYDVNDGSIKIDGVDIRDFTRDGLRSQFAMVLQDTWLFNGTVMENIRYGKPDATDEEVIAAAKTAQAHDFITATDKGYDYMLSSKGTNVSGGQRQRILIARALLSKPEILILDDSSSALDYKTDAALRKALAKELKNSTVITVAQRVSSVKNCDLILVLEEGKIIGKGTHEYLIENCKEYKEISDSQMGGAFVED